MKEQLIALLVTTAIAQGAIIAQYDDPKLNGSTFTITFENEPIIQAPGGNVVGNAGLRVSIKAAGNNDVFLKDVGYLFNTFGLYRKGIEWSSEGEFANMGENITNNVMSYNNVEFWEDTTESSLVFDSGDELTLYYPGMDVSNVLTQRGAMYIKFAPTDDPTGYNLIRPTSINESVPEPSSALLTLLAALGTLRRKR